MSAIATPRVRPAVTVEPDPTEQYPDAYSVVSPTVVPVYAGHWGAPGTTYAGMWVLPFNNELLALAAVHNLRRLGHAS
jgi:hypothetical protein